MYIFIRNALVQDTECLTVSHHINLPKVDSSTHGLLRKNKIKKWRKREALSLIATRRISLVT